MQIGYSYAEQSSEENTDVLNSTPHSCLMGDRSTTIISALIYDLPNISIHVIDSFSFSIYILH